MDAIEKKTQSEVQSLFMRCQISQDVFDGILQPIIETCTKDAISVSYFFSAYLLHCRRPRIHNFTSAWI